MKKIKLTKNKYAIIDDDDFELVRHCKWCCQTGYAYNGTLRVYMHRLINNTPVDSVTDHINGNRLDNRKSNLRNANKSLNAHNRHSINSNNNSGYNGVYWDKTYECWKSQITISGKRVFVGSFRNKKIASQMRNVLRTQLGINI